MHYTGILVSFSPDLPFQHLYPFVTKFTLQAIGQFDVDLLHAQ